MSIKLDERIVDVLESNGWSILQIFDNSRKPDPRYPFFKSETRFDCELEWFSDAGEDFVTYVIYDGTVDGFVKGFKEAYDCYNIDEHVDMWISSRGLNGVPSSVRCLLEDAEGIEKHMLDTYLELREI